MDFYLSEVKVSTEKQIFCSITGQILHIPFLTNTAYTLWIQLLETNRVSAAQRLLSADT